MLWGCKSNSNNVKKNIILGDTSVIVMEQDSMYLVNNTNDITPTKSTSASKNISDMLVQIDSAHAQKELNETNVIVNGFKTSLGEFEMEFNSISAHALNPNQNTTTGASFIFDSGNFSEAQLLVTGLENTQIEQRNFTTLHILNDKKSIQLHDLGKYCSQWYILPNKENKFISVGNNSYQFYDISIEKIKLAYERELRKQKTPNSQIIQILDELKHIKSYNESPCVVTLKSIQYRIKGLKNGKRVQKMIQFDVLDK